MCYQIYPNFKYTLLKIEVWKGGGGVYHSSGELGEGDRRVGSRKGSVEGRHFFTDEVTLGAWRLERALDSY